MEEREAATYIEPDDDDDVDDFDQLADQSVPDVPILTENGDWSTYAEYLQKTLGDDEGLFADYFYRIPLLLFMYYYSSTGRVGGQGPLQCKPWKTMEAVAGFRPEPFSLDRRRPPQSIDMECILFPSYVRCESICASNDNLPTKLSFSRYGQDICCRRFVTKR